MFQINDSHYLRSMLSVRGQSVNINLVIKDRRKKREGTRKTIVERHIVKLVMYRDHVWSTFLDIYIGNAT